MVRALASSGLSQIGSHLPRSHRSSSNGRYRVCFVSERLEEQYALTGVFISTYLAYHLGGKFLNALGWIGVLETSGVNISGVYGNLFWFGLGATVCYLLVILVLRRSYGKLAIARRKEIRLAKTEIL